MTMIQSNGKEEALNHSIGHFDQYAVGIGLRHPHIEDFLSEDPDIDWLEVHSENFMGAGGPRIEALQMIAQRYPISAHGVGLSLGSADGLDPNHLHRLKHLLEWLNPVMVSEHVSWSVTSGTYLNDLLPLPYTQEALDVICRNISQTQDYLGRQIIVENPSSYLTYTDADMPEWAFMNAIHDKTECGILLDINNIYVSAQNHNFDASFYIEQIAKDAVCEYHLAGHSEDPLGDQKTILVDTHSKPVSPNVWPLYQHALDTIGARPTLIEWDLDIPELPILLAEAKKARALMELTRGDNDAA